MEVGHESMGVNGTSCGFWAWRSKAKTWPSGITMPDVEFDHSFHLVRHPLMVLRTLPIVLGKSKVHKWLQALGFVRDEPWDLTATSLRYWVETHRRLLALGIPRVRVENLENDWQSVVQPKLGISLLADTDARGTMGKHNSILHNDYAQRILPPAMKPLTWEQLAQVDQEYTDAARRITKKFGYDVA